MALPLCSNGMPSLYGSSSLFLTTKPIFRLSLKPVNFVGVCDLRPIAANKRGSLIVKASSDVLDSNDVQPESDDEDFIVDELALDAKLQTKLEKKLRMKIAKKIRLRKKETCSQEEVEEEGPLATFKDEKIEQCLNLASFNISFRFTDYRFVLRMDVLY